MSENILIILNDWFERKVNVFTDRSITATLTKGPGDRNPQSAWVDFITDTHSARIMVWSDGQADIMMGNLVSQVVILDEHRTIITDQDLDRIAQEMCVTLG
jgi:hypothetical protein